MEASAVEDLGTGNVLRLLLWQSRCVPWSSKQSGAGTRGVLQGQTHRGFTPIPAWGQALCPARTFDRGAGTQSPARGFCGFFGSRCDRVLTWLGLRAVSKWM